MKQKQSNKRKNKHANEFIQNTGLADTTTSVYQFFMKMTVMTQILYNILLCMD